MVPSRLSEVTCLLATLAMLLPGLAVAGESSDRIYSVSIHMLPRPDSPQYPPYQAWFANHPHVRPTRATQLKIETLQRGSLMMAIAGGTAPDILRVYHHEAKAWIRNGFLEKLDKYIYKDSAGD